MTPLRPSDLGDATHPSPLRFFVPDDVLVPSDTQWPQGLPPSDMLLFEKAGPRRQLFFDPLRTRAADRHLRRAVSRAEQRHPLACSCELQHSYGVHDGARHPLRLPGARSEPAASRRSS